ncbi:MAG: hypothetical protein QM804_01360 [Propionicimonas sp.]
MRPLGRVIGAAVLAALLSGCHMAWMLEEPVPPVPDVTLGPTPTPTPTPTPIPEPDPYAYQGKPAKKAKCVTLKAEQLAHLQNVGSVGGAITYSRGSMVRSNDDWWAIAVMTQVHPNESGYTRESVPEQHFFVVAAESSKWTEPATGYRLSDYAKDAAIRKAAGCASKLPVPKPKLEPTDPKTYTGKLAKGATCRAASADLLAHLEQVGQVGGAITYPRGQLVRANGKWWTVAVATQVNPNGAGLTRENVPSTALFVTNAPSYRKSSDAQRVYFPLKPGKKDTAAAKALRCLDAD